MEVFVADIIKTELCKIRLNSQYKNVGGFKTVRQMATAVNLNDSTGQKHGLSIVINDSAEFETSSNIGKNEHLPPHAEIYDGKHIPENFVGELVLTLDPDDQKKRTTVHEIDSKDQLINMNRSPRFNSKIKKRLLDCLQDTYNNTGMSVWERVVNMWNDQNKKHTIEMVD